MENDTFLPGNKTVLQQPKQEKKDKHVPRYCQAAILVLFVLAIILLIALLVMVVEWRNIRVDALKKSEQTVCVKAGLLEYCPIEYQGQNESCCGPTSHIISALVEKYSLEKFKNTSGARMLSEKCLKEEDKSVAKLPGLDMDRIHEQGEGTCVFWDGKNADKILQNVYYKKGCLQISKPGYYYVYSQIVLSKEPTNTTLPFFSHSIFGGKSEKREKLLESSNSPCDTTSGGTEMSSYIGAVFYFEANETIHVETTHPQNLVDLRENNFFGLYSV